MAHMIDETTGRPSIAYAGETPWHKLGRKMTDNERRDIAAALKLAGLDWQVEAIDLQYTRPATLAYPTITTMHPVPDARGIIRLDTGTYLGTVGTGYTAIQNREAAETVDALVREHGCTVEVAASLDGGKRAFCLLKMPDATLTPAPGDDVRGYLLVNWAHDGSGAVRIVLTPIRVVCQNTLSAAYHAGFSSVATVRHTKSAPDALKTAAKVAQQMHKALVKTGETYAELARRTMNAKELAAYIETVIPSADASLPLSDTIKERREEIARLIFDGKHVADSVTNASYGISTAWRAYNAVTEYFDHVRAREAKSTSARMTAYDSALFGGNAAIKANALRVLVAA